MTYREAAPGPVLVSAFGGRVFGLEPATGQVLWEREVAVGTTLSLVVEPTVVYVAGGGTLAAIGYPDGALRWSAPLTVGGRAALVHEAGRLYVGASGEVECFTVDGKRLWHNEFKGKGLATVALGFPDNVAQADLNT